MLYFRYFCECLHLCYLYPRLKIWAVFFRTANTRNKRIDLLIIGTKAHHSNNRLRSPRPGIKSTFRSAVPGCYAEFLHPINSAIPRPLAKQPNSLHKERPSLPQLQSQWPHCDGGFFLRFWLLHYRCFLELHENRLIQRTLNRALETTFQYSRPGSVLVQDE